MNIYERCQELIALFDLKVVAITFGRDGTTGAQNRAAIAYGDGHFYCQEKYEVEIVDQIGAGDAFAGGFLYAYLSSQGDVKRALNYGVAASALKLTCSGDINWCTLEEVEKLIAGQGDREMDR